jgi:ERCC4-type nuclease
MKIVVDTRERPDVRELLEQRIGNTDIDFAADTYDAGDFAFYDNETLLMLIERKTWDDLAASIKDGRMDEQFGKLLDVKHKTGAVVTYIIEGKLHSQHQNMAADMLESKLRHGLIRGIGYICTRDLTDTIDLLVKFANDLVKVNPIKSCKEEVDILANRFTSLVIAGVDDVVEPAKFDLKQKKELTIERVMLDVLHKVPKVGPSVASDLLAKGFKLWMFADRVELAKLLATIRTKSGKAVSVLVKNSMLDVACNVDVQVAIVAELPGIGRKTAKSIIDAISFVDILTEPDKLSTIKVNGKRISKSSVDWIKKLTTR